MGHRFDNVYIVDAVRHVMLVAMCGFALVGGQPAGSHGQEWIGLTCFEHVDHITEVNGQEDLEGRIAQKVKDKKGLILPKTDWLTD